MTKTPGGGLGESNPNEVRVPRVALSDGARLLRWVVPDGVAVGPCEVVCELEYDRAFLTVEVFVFGILCHVAGEGDQVKPGDLLARITRSL